MKRFLLVFVLVGCSRESRDAAPPAPVCGDVPARETIVDAVTGTLPAWRVDLGKDGVFVGAADEIIVARRAGGRTIAIDAETGATCLTLLPELASPINAYSAQNVLIDGALVGPNGARVSAIDLRTGALRFTKTLVGVVGDQPDESVLSTSLHAISAGQLMIFGFPIHYTGKDAHVEELIVAVDSHTGTERWRRTVVTHPKDAVVERGGTIALAADGARVFVRTAKDLVAFETTGADAWTVPLPESNGRAPLLAASHGHVALASTSGAIHVYDAQHGTSVSNANVTHVPSALVFGASMLFVATDAPEIVAIDPASAKTIFTHAAAYSVAKLHADETSVLSIEGDGRARAIDAKTGEPQWGVAVGPVYAAELMKTKSGAARLVVPSRGLAAFDPASGAKANKLDPFLRWDFTKTSAACGAQSVAWIDGDENVVWRREVPPRLRDAPWGDACDEGPIAEYRHHPRGAEMLLVGLIGGGGDGDTLAFADPSGIWAISKSDGHVLFDAPLPGQDKPNTSRLFDSGTFHLAGDPPCDGPATYAHVFARCADHLLYFNGKTAAWVSMAPWRIESRATWMPSVPLRLGARDLVLHADPTTH